MTDPKIDRVERAEILMSDLALHICEPDGDVWMREFENFMRKRICWVIDKTTKKEREAPLLIEQYTVYVKDTVNSYREALERGVTGHHRCFFDGTFNLTFSSFATKDSRPANLVCRELQDSASDKEIIAALGGEELAITPLPVFFGALNTPFGGNPSVFGESDVYHIFYVRDDRGVIWALSVSCRKGAPRFIAAHLLVSNARWDKGRRVFSVQ